MWLSQDLSCIRTLNLNLIEHIDTKCKITHIQKFLHFDLKHVFTLFPYCTVGGTFPYSCTVYSWKTFNRVNDKYVGLSIKQIIFELNKANFVPQPINNNCLSGTCQNCQHNQSSTNVVRGVGFYSKQNNL